MPVLKTPEVIHEPRLSGLITYFQKPRTELPDMELMEEATDFSGHLGFNPVINYATVNIPPFERINPDDITLRLTLSEAWRGKDHIFAEITQLDISIRPDTPSPWAGKSETYVVNGGEKILRLGDYLREKFEKSTRDDGAVYFRPIIHPALLGTIMDDVEQAIATKTKFSSGEHPWKQAFLDYGWRG